MSNLNIAIVVNTSWNIFNFRINLLDYLKTKGFKVTLIAPKDDYSEKLINRGFEFIEIKMNNKGVNPIEDLGLTYQLYKIFKENSFDLALLYTIKPNIYGNIAAKLASVPTISTITGLGTVFLNERLSSKIARQLYKHSLKYSKKVFFQNRDDMNMFINKNLVSNKLIDYIPGSGIDTEKFKPSDKKNDNSKFKFLMVARLVKDKGLIEYLEASELLKSRYSESVEFCLLGEFYEGNPTAISREELDVWIKKGVITYLGSSDNVKAVMEEHNCIVLPSYREGLSRVLLEGASMEKPIVTTNVPGCKDVVDNGVNGFICEPYNSISLSDAMEKMLNLINEDLVDMGNKSRCKVIEKFSSDIVVKKYLDIIYDILKGKY